MTFTTLNFAIFMAILFLVYYIVPKKIQWLAVLTGNLVFYYFMGLKCLIFLVAVMLLTYISGILINRIKDKGALLIVIFTITIFTGLLCAMRLGFSSYIQPIGLSYYSLMCLGYVISVYWKMVEAEKNPLKLMTYVAYFPHIIQGPFDDYKKLNEQFFAPHYFDYDNAVKAVMRIAVGIAKKMVLADRIGNIVNAIFDEPADYYGFTVFVCIVLYSFQLYADFSGYMDIAVGCSKLLGIEIAENFNSPFLSKSMEEFWRRWHMSLGIWFKNYVFFPVQRTKVCADIRKKFKKNGNKYAASVFPTVIGLIIVWTLIGLWHGFDWNYLLYDWTCGLIIVLSTLFGPLYAKINSLNEKLFSSRIMDVLRVVRTFLLVTFTFVLFRPDSVNDSIIILHNLIAKPDLYTGAEFVYWNAYDFFLIAPMLIVLIVMDVCKYREIDFFEKIHKLNPVVRYFIYVAGLVYIYVARYNGQSLGFAYSIF